MGWHAMTQAMAASLILSLPLCHTYDAFAVVQPFAPSDAARLSDGYEPWTRFSPCNEPPAIPVDLFLCFSQDIADYPHIASVLA
jgi:hypothetical protein